MPPKKLKSREGNPAALPDLVSKFPFRVGDEVEMKSHESGYRGAWFRVQVGTFVHAPGFYYCMSVSYAFLTTAGQVGWVAAQPMNLVS